MIPDQELHLYLRLLDRASACANQEDFAAGEHYLSWGLRRARAFQRAGRAWGEELAEQFRYAHERYCTQHCVLRDWQPACSGEQHLSPRPGALVAH